MTLFDVFAIIVILFFGWCIRVRYFRLAAKSRPLRLFTIGVGVTCLIVLALVMLRHVVR